jgi:hypothetical protein
MENILNVSLATETSPVVQEVRGRDYIEYSDASGEWKNLYPNFLIDLYNSSSTHAAIVTTTSDMIAGEDIVVDENENLEQFVKLKQFFSEANSKETLHEIIKKISFDFKLQGAFALHIIYNKARTAISEIHHIGVERIRAGKPNAMGKIDCYYVCADWSNTRTNKPMKVAAFNPKDRTNPSQILYTGLYSPNMDIYHTPDYIAANCWILTDSKVSEYMLNVVSSGFSGTHLISFANGVPSQEERMQIERSLAAKFQGSQNAGSLVLTFSDDKTRTPEITPIAMSDSDKQFLNMQETLVQNILTAHRVTSPLLFGIRDKNNGLGSNVDEMNSAFEIYLNTVVKNYQNQIIKTLAKIFEVNGINIPFSFIQSKPITSKFDMETLKSVMTQDEIREEMGLKPLAEDEIVEEDENVNLAKVGTMITDGKELPLFDSVEEAEEEAERLGCSGHHIHTQDGKEYFMPCADHNQLINLKDCDCGKNKDKCDKSCYEKTELDKAIEEFGEDMPEGWEVYHEQEVEDELEDFNFEEQLNLSYHEFATTGSAYPNRKSGQDQRSKQDKYKDDIYRVRYRYAGKSTGEREFCRKMTKAGKIYRKEDIIAMGNRAVNPGWGKGGADTYSIWKYKGGGNCYHKWFRIILVQTGNRPKNSDTIITSTEARSRGVKLPRNAKEVSVAPIDLPNNGFVKKR